MSALPPALVALTPGRLRDADGTRGAAELERRLRAALAAGLRGVCLREPELGDRALLALALAVRAELDRQADQAGEPVWLCVHDRVHLAAAAQADAVHLGFRSLAPREARALLGREVAIGLSTHARDFAPGAERDLAEVDYLFHGPVAATPSKAGLEEPIGVAGLASAARASRAPIWALGGLAPGDAPALAEAGAQGFATLGGILAAPDPGAAARAYARAAEAFRARAPRGERAP